MAEENRKDRGVSSTVAIPSGLNRIRTRLASSGPRPEDSSDTVLKPPFNRNQKIIVPRGHGITTGSSKQGFDFKIMNFCFSLCSSDLWFFFFSVLS